MDRPTIQEQIDYINKSTMTVVKLATVTPSLKKDVAILVAIEETLKSFDAIIRHANHINHHTKKSHDQAKEL